MSNSISTSQATQGKSALIIIDPQNDYLPGGKYPLWNMEESIKKIIEAMDRAKEKGMSIYFVQHLAPEDAPFFKKAVKALILLLNLKCRLPMQRWLRNVMRTALRKQNSMLCFWKKE